MKFGVLWKLDLETWRVEKLVDEDRVIGAFTVSPDGRRIAIHISGGNFPGKRGRCASSPPSFISALLIASVGSGPKDRKAKLQA